MEFHSKTVGNCLTEYTHPHYEILVKQFNKFYLISQFDYTPNLEYPVKSATWQPKILDKPKCGYGEVLYGIDEKNQLVKLKAIIDSSD